MTLEAGDYIELTQAVEDEPVSSWGLVDRVLGAGWYSVRFPVGPFGDYRLVVVRDYECRPGPSVRQLREMEAAGL